MLSKPQRAGGDEDAHARAAIDIMFHQWAPVPESGPILARLPDPPLQPMRQKR